MSANRFPKFPDLPAELRRMICSFCIPGRRVYEMHTAMLEHHDNVLGGSAYEGDNGSTLWWSWSGRFPVISHVCREGRELVLESHVYITAEAGKLDDDGVPCPEWETWNECLPVRLRKGFDVVHLHWTREYYYPIYLPGPPNPLLYFQWLANQAAAASVSAELLHAFDSGTTSSRITPEEVKYFSPYKLYYVVLTIVEIHMTYYEAAHAGVFGRLGEEPIQLVDPRDTTAVARLRDVWRRHRLPSEEPEHAEFFSRAVDSAEAYCARIEQWRQELETVWIWYKCQELRVPNETLSEIWPDPNRPAGHPVHLAFAFPFRRPGAPTSSALYNRRGPNKEHPWVQAQLALMPRFEPALMFRHCARMCSLPGKRDWRDFIPFQREGSGVARGGRAVMGDRAGTGDGTITGDRAVTGGRAVRGGRRRTRWGP